MEWYKKPSVAEEMNKRIVRKSIVASKKILKAKLSVEKIFYVKDQVKVSHPWKLIIYMEKNLVRIIS